MKKPYIKLIQASQGIDEALVFLNGYKMKYEKNSKLWSTYLRRANWKGSIYQLWWDSGSKYGLKYCMSPLGSIPILNELGSLVHHDPHWRMVLNRAKEGGLRYLPALISSIPENKISFIGYSLGCRFIYYGLRSKKTNRLTSKSINDIILLGGAIRTIGWDDVASKIDGNVYNFYNINDPILNVLFSYLGLYKYKPCGINPIKTRCKNIKNVNVTTPIRADSHKLKVYLRSLTQHDYLNRID